jgi:16S rRNA (adenine1518-N6/adenine1519-N6)-dimethyltransferase
MPNPHKARKRFGQNFLNNEQTIQRLVSAISPHPQDQLIEIGPGLAAMTQPLLRRVDKMEVIELDRDLVKRLQQLDPSGNKLIIHQGDALKFDFSNTPYARRVVGNLPYNISTPIIFHLLKHLTYIVDMHFMLQKEVVDRICARPGERNFGRLSAMVHSQCHAESLFEIQPQDFTPAPKVTSAFMRLSPHPQPLVSAHLRQDFAQMVKLVFTQPRKTLANNLKKTLTIEQIEALDIDPSTRPQNLHIEQLIKLTKYRKEQP